jgi:hypothetical protein
LLRIILVNAYDVPVPQRPRISVPVILLASTSAAERDSAILNAMLDLPGLVVLTHDMTGDDDGDVEIVTRQGGVLSLSPGVFRGMAGPWARFLAQVPPEVIRDKPGHPLRAPQ